MEVSKDKILLLLAEKSMTITDLAVASGISRCAVYRLINGKTQPRTKTVGRLATTLGVAVIEIIK